LLIIIILGAAPAPEAMASNHNQYFLWGSSIEAEVRYLWREKPMQLRATLTTLRYWLQYSLRMEYEKKEIATTD